MSSATDRVQQPVSSLELGVIGNSALAALVTAQGAITWLCMPRMDGDPVFCSLLSPVAGPHEGEWSIRLIDQVASSQRYIRNTAILETVLTDAAGNSLKITDFAPRFHQDGRIFRGLNIIRLVEVSAGTPRVVVRIRPRAGYGAHPAARRRGSNHLRFVAGEEVMRLTTDAPIDYIDHETPFLVEKPFAMVLGPDESLSDNAMAISRRFLRDTKDYWQNWSRALALPPDYQQLTIRAAITLKLCSYEDTGAIMAALTTSIPEYGDTGRTWDYRFCWLRDSYFTVQALNSLNATHTMERYLQYVSNLVASAPDGLLQPLFGLGCETQVDEYIVPDLAGYRGLGPVRRGNGAWTQIQNDGYGSVIMAVTQAFFDERLPSLGGVDLFHRLEQVGREAAKRWNQPDAGLWEFRTRSEVHTHSAVMCWAACDRLARIAAHLGLAPEQAQWSATAARIHAEICERGWNDSRGCFVASFGGEDVDASLLLMAQTGFLHPRDPRFTATLAACERDLREGNHLYRYRRPDDFGAPETAFSACTFWLIDALLRSGRKEEAREIFDDIRARCTPLGLLSEGVHTQSGELWGNFPQTYSMVGLINASVALSRSWEEVL